MIFIILRHGWSSSLYVDTCLGNAHRIIHEARVTERHSAKTGQKSASRLNVRCLHTSKITNRSGDEGAMAYTAITILPFLLNFHHQNKLTRQEDKTRLDDNHKTIKDKMLTRTRLSQDKTWQDKTRNQKTGRATEVVCWSQATVGVSVWLSCLRFAWSYSSPYLFPLPHPPVQKIQRANWAIEISFDRNRLRWCKRCKFNRRLPQIQICLQSQRVLYYCTK